MPGTTTNTGPEHMEPAQRPAGSSTADIEQVKSPTSDAHFLQIGAKTDRRVGGN
jgi:hypothetical protein